MTLAELVERDVNVEYLVEDLIVAQQPILLAGPVKSLKTSLMLDLSLALATGVPFLGTFRVLRKIAVAVLTWRIRSAGYQGHVAANRTGKAYRHQQSRKAPHQRPCAAPGESTAPRRDPAADLGSRVGTAFVDPAYRLSTEPMPPT